MELGILLAYPNFKYLINFPWDAFTSVLASGVITDRKTHTVFHPPGNPMVSVCSILPAPFFGQVPRRSSFGQTMPNTLKHSVFRLPSSVV